MTVTGDVIGGSNNIIVETYQDKTLWNCRYWLRRSERQPKHNLDINREVQKCWDLQGFKNVISPDSERRLSEGIETTYETQMKSRTAWRNIKTLKINRNVKKRSITTKFSENRDICFKLPWNNIIRQRNQESYCGSSKIFSSFSTRKYSTRMEKHSY